MKFHILLLDFHVFTLRYCYGYEIFNASERWIFKTLSTVVTGTIGPNTFQLQGVAFLSIAGVAYLCYLRL